MQPLLKVEQAAEALGVEAGTIYKWTATGRLACVRISRRALRIRQEDIDALIESRRTPSVMETTNNPTRALARR